MRKVIQFTCDRDALYVLCNDGAMFYTTEVLNDLTTKPNWQWISSVPQPTKAMVETLGQEPSEPVEEQPKPKPRPPKRPPELPPAEVKPEVQPEVTEPVMDNVDA